MLVLVACPQINHQSLVGLKAVSHGLSVAALHKGHIVQHVPDSAVHQQGVLQQGLLHPEVYHQVVGGIGPVQDVVLSARLGTTNGLQSGSSSILWNPIQILFHDSIGKESNRYDDAYAFSGSENQGAYLQL